MKTYLIFLSLILSGVVFGQSARKRHKLLVSACTYEKLKQDSAQALFVRTRQVFDSARLAFNDNAYFLVKRERHLLDLFHTTSGLSYQLRTLGVEPVPALIPDYRTREFTDFREFIRPMEPAIKNVLVFERVPGEMYLDGLSRKEQNLILEKRLEEYREYGPSNAMKQDNLELVLGKVLAFLPRMDSLINTYDLLAEDLVRDNSMLQKKLDELEADFRNKGPEGFSYAYHRVFPELFPDYFPPEKESVFVGAIESPDNFTDVWEESYPQEKASQGPIYDVTDEPAVFPGGEEKMSAYIKHNRRDTEELKSHRSSGKAYVRFVVLETGKISDVRLMKGVPNCKACDAEAIRLVKSMPNWIPAKQNGRPVNTELTIPISFE